MLGSFLPFSFPESGKWIEQLFIIYNLCWVSILHTVLSWTLRVELFILHTLSSRVLNRLCSVQFYKKTFSTSILYTLCWILLKTLVECPLHTVGIIQSDTSESDPVSFQFKEPRQNECREEEENFARARSRPDPRKLSRATAGKNSQEPRSCDMFVEYGGSINDNSAKLAPTSNTSIFDTIATVSADVEPTLRTSVRDTFAIERQTTSVFRIFYFGRSKFRRQETASCFISYEIL